MAKTLIGELDYSPEYVLPASWKDVKQAFRRVGDVVEASDFLATQHGYVADPLELNTYLTHADSAPVLEDLEEELLPTADQASLLQADLGGRIVFRLYLYPDFFDMTTKEARELTFDRFGEENEQAELAHIYAGRQEECLLVFEKSGEIRLVSTESETSRFDYIDDEDNLTVNLRTHHELMQEIDRSILSVAELEVRRYERSAEDLVLSSLTVPRVLREALHWQRSYRISLCWSNIDRRMVDGRPFDALLLCVELKELVNNPDRFLRAFASKLNKWVRQVQES